MGIVFAVWCLEMLLKNTKILLPHRLFSHELARYYMKRLSSFLMVILLLASERQLTKEEGI